MADSEHQDNPAEFPDPGAKGSRKGATEQSAPAAAVSGGSLKSLLFVFLILLFALAGLAVYAAHWKQEVDVRAFVLDGLSLIRHGELSMRLNGYKGRKMQEVDPEELKSRIFEHPYVRDAQISKELNGIVRVRVSERQPIALTMLDGKVMAIDREGVILPGKQEFLGRIPKFLVVSGISRFKKSERGLQQLEERDVELLKQFLEALTQSEYACLLICELHLDGGNMSYCKTLQAPARFIVGNDGKFKEKLKKFEIFWQKVVSKKGYNAYESVDLRFRDRIFTREPEAVELPQSASL